MIFPLFTGPVWKRVVMIMVIAFGLLVVAGAIVWSQISDNVYIRTVALREMMWSPDGSQLALFYTNYSKSASSTQVELDILYWNAEGKRSVRRIVSPAGIRAMPFAISWSPDGKKMAFFIQGANQYDIAVMNLDDPAAASVQWPSVTGQPFTGVVMEWSPDNSMLTLYHLIPRPRVAGSATISDPYVRVLDVAGRGELPPGAAPLLPEPQCQAAAWSRDNRLALFLSKEICVWDRKAGTAVRRIPLPISSAGPVSSLEWSPDGTMIKVVRNKRSWIYDLKNNRTVLDSTGFWRFSPDSKTVAAAFPQSSLEGIRVITQSISPPSAADPELEKIPPTDNLLTLSWTTNGKYVVSQLFNGKGYDYGWWAPSTAPGTPARLVQTSRMDLSAYDGFSIPFVDEKQFQTWHPSFVPARTGDRIATQRTLRIGTMLYLVTITNAPR